MNEKIRIDKWLWAARFYKTRSLAAQDLTKGRIFVNDIVAKPSRDVQAGDRVRIHKDTPAMEVWVKQLSAIRGPATVARTLYEETPESVTIRARAAEQRRLAPEPALAYDQGRPTKRDRRRLQNWKSDADT